MSLLTVVSKTYLDSGCKCNMHVCVCVCVFGAPVPFSILLQRAPLFGGSLELLSSSYR